MKHNQFLGIFFAGFLFLSLSWSFGMQAGELSIIENAGEDSFSITKHIDEDGAISYDAVDAEKNVMTKLTQDEVEALEKSQVKDLKQFAKDFGKTKKLLSKEQADAFLSENKEIDQAVTKLKNEKLSGLAKSDLEKRIVDNKTLEANYQAKGAVQRTQKAIDKMVDRAGNNADQLAKDFKGNPNLKNLGDKYLRKFDDIPKPFLEKLKGLKSPISDAALDFKSEMETAIKAGDRKTVETLCVKISKLDAMSGLSDQISSLQKDAANGIAGLEDGIQKAMDQSLTDLNSNFDAIEKDPESLLTDVDTGVKDAGGNMQKEPMVDKFRRDLKSSVSGGAKTSLSNIIDKIDGTIEELGEKLGTVNKAFSGFKGVFSGHALSDTYDSIKSTMKTITRDDIADGFVKFGKKILRGGGKTLELLEEGGKMLISGVMFMIPNIFQSAFLAQKQRQSELQTLASPIKFGDWVFQIPDSCFNFSNPSATLPIYVRVPVANVGDDVSQQMQTQFNNDISGPTSDNKVSAAIHSVGATIASFFGNLTARPQRYSMKEAGYLAQNPGIVLAYFANNYPQWGSVALTSSQFTSGQVIDMNGVIIDGSSNQISATGITGYDAYPMQTPLDWHAQPPQQPLVPDNMKDFIATMQSRMALSGDDVKYIEYSTVGAGAAGATGSAGLQAAFDCSCLNPESTQACATGSCAINATVQGYFSGCSFDATLLGSVQPLTGWGTTEYPLLINSTTFPGYSGGSQATAFKVGKTQETSDFADPKKNHALLGCWVYLSANTPFAQAVAGNSKSTRSVTGPYVDYIIFLNEQNEQVPLMVPVQKQYEMAEKNQVKSQSAVPEVYGTYTVLAQNPNIKYWTSLASFDSSTNQPLPGFEDETTGYPLKYDLDGNKYADSTLAGPKGLIANAITDLGTFSNLAAQFATHQAAMQYKIENGPFNYGNIGLTLSDLNITVPGSSANAPQAVVPLYEGSSCFGSFEDDLLVALDANNSYLTLPSPNVAMFYSLITDVGYKVVNNCLVPSDFSQAAMLEQLPTTPVTYSLSNTLQNFSTYNVLDELLEESLESQYPLPSKTTSYISKALDQYVAAQRKAWAANFDSSGQKQGITVGALTCSLPAEFNTKAAIASNAFFYEISPNPSAAFCDNDLFVLTTSSQPSLTGLTPINAEDAATATTYAVSLITGFVFDMHGNQVMNGTTPVRLTTPLVSTTTMHGTMNKVQTITGQIYQAMTTQFDFEKFATQNFEKKYHDWAQNYEVQMHRLIGPYSFGSLNVGIFAGDDAIGNYIYFPAQHMHEEDFTPSDVFVACQGTFPQLTFPVQLNDQTTYMLSLISGNLYDSNNNIVSRLPASDLLKQTNGLIDNWGNWLKNTVTDLQDAMTQRIETEQNEQAQLDAILGSIQSPKYLLASDVKQIIAGLTPGASQGLTPPYGLLQYNPIKEIYVHLSPLSGNESDGMLYMLFDIGIDKATNKHVGGIYTADGKFVRLVKGLELEVMEKQFGIVINSDGSQTLGIPLTQPFFEMKDPSAQLVLGQNSADGDLISSLSNQFPGGPVKIKKGFYLYFSMSMKTYYVYDVANSRWISCAGNHVYHKDGSPIPLSQEVAMLQSTASKRKSTSIATADDMILLYENIHDADQGYMSDGQDYITRDLNSSKMTWTSLSGNSNLTVTKNSTGTTYTVVDSAGSSKVYKVSSKFVWHSLFEVPIDDNGALQQRVGFSYRRAQLVTSDDKPTHLLFHEVMYKVSSKSGNKYSMVPVVATNNAEITMTQEQDENTGAQYWTVFDGNNTYKYMYVMDSLDEDAQSYYRSKFAGTTSVAARAFPAGPVTSNVVTIGNQNITVSVPNESTHVLFVKDIANVSTLAVATLSSVLDLPTGSELEILMQKFNGNVLASSDGRFFTSIPAYDPNNPATFSYVSNGAYLDLYNGVLFDTATGISLGYCLNQDDWLSVLNNVGVSVMLAPNNAKSKSAKMSLVLRYRSADTVNIQTAQLVADAQAEADLKEFTASVPSLNESGAAVSGALAG